VGAAPLAAGVEAEAEEGGSRSKFDTSNLLTIALTLFLGSRIFPLSDLKLTALFRFTGGLLASAFKTTFLYNATTWKTSNCSSLIDSNRRA
jgi:hypothetical protein